MSENHDSQSELNIDAFEKVLADYTEATNPDSPIQRSQWEQYLTASQMIVVNINSVKTFVSFGDNHWQKFFEIAYANASFPQEFTMAIATWHVMSGLRMTMQCPESRNPSHTAVHLCHVVHQSIADTQLSLEKGFGLHIDYQSIIESLRFASCMFIQHEIDDITGYPNLMVVPAFPGDLWQQFSVHYAWPVGFYDRLLKAEGFEY